MSPAKKLVIGEFLKPQDMMSAVLETRQLGLTIREVYSPYEVPGLAETLGRRRSRLPWLCLFLGITGAAIMLWFQFWTSSVDWPINVGGKPWNSLPAYVPVTFEFMVLFTGAGVVAALLWVGRLFPGKKAHQLSGRSTDDRFVVVIEGSDSRFDSKRVRKIFLRNGASLVSERVESQHDSQ